jgi:uncharacterized protein YunC (DUF1805 family)
MIMLKAVQSAKGIFLLFLQMSIDKLSFYLILKDNQEFISVGYITSTFTSKVISVSF